MAKSIDDLLKRGIAAANSGDLETARTLLAQVVLSDPTSEQGWLTLSYCVSTPKHREQCLRKVLEINPSNNLALELLQEEISPTQLPNLIDTNPEIQKVTEKEEPTRSKKLPFDIRNIIHAFENLSVLGSGITGVLAAVIIIGIPTFLLVRSFEPPNFFIQVAQVLVPSPNFRESADPAALPQSSATTIIPTETLSPSISPAEDFATRFQYIYGDILQAVRYQENEDYTSAVLTLDNIIDVVPEYGRAYFLRALSYDRMNQNQRSLNVYIDNLYAAHADINKAIDLGPIRGDYYYQRYLIGVDFAGIEDFFLDTYPWKEQALQDLISATQLGTNNTFANSDPGFFLVGLNRCLEALSFFSSFMEAQDPELPPSATVHHGLAASYQCLGDYEMALQQIDTAIDITRSSSQSIQRIEILFNLGRHSEILGLLSESIETYPTYAGDRYYMRAMIYYQMGETELALQDLEAGLRNTWTQYDFRAYVLGQIALDEGDEATGLQWLQLAEASITPYRFPDLHKSIQDDIKSLGGEPDTFYQEWKPSIRLSDIPIIPDQDGDIPPQSVYLPADMLVNYSGAGTYYVKGGDSLLFLFRPNEIAQIVEAQSLTLNIEGGVPNEETTLQISYLSKDGSWGGFDTMVWGENGILHPARFVDSHGYIVISIKNFGFDPVFILNCSVRLVAINADGTQSVYGFR